MLITFHSKATANVLMRAEDAAPLLRAAGKTIGSDFPTHGVFTPDQLVAAIAGLEAAIHAAPPPLDDDSDPRHTKVTLRQRAFPLLEMMHKALAADAAITWESSRGW
ncbi:MAG TPA: DUF1840 domain-containing protein [Bordetella sp.]